MSSRDLSDLEPETQALAKQFLHKCAAAGIDILIYCTYRSINEQNIIYAQGRTSPGKIITNARGGQSWHNWKRAFDFVPLVGGKPAWNSTSLYKQCGEIGESLGLEWAGRWTGSLRETAHMQYTKGKTLTDMLKGT